MSKTAIEWTNYTCNPITGCTVKSPGCAYCYAKTTHDRRHKAKLEGKKITAKQYDQPFDVVQFHPERMLEPTRIKEPSRFFMCSGADIGHEDVPFEYLDYMFAGMAQCPWHLFQLLTKRPERILEYFTSRDSHLAMTREFRNFKDYTEPVGPWPLPNVEIGVTCENQHWAEVRIPILFQIPAAVRWVSEEPSLGMIDYTKLRVKNALGQPIYLDALAGQYWNPNDHDDLPRMTRRLDWVVQGGETGSNRWMAPAWARSSRDACAANNVPYLFKQWGDWGPCWEEEETTDEEHHRHGCQFSNNTDGGERDLFTGGTYMRRLGKKKAGRLLDGVTHDGYPLRDLGFHG